MHILIYTLLAILLLSCSSKKEQALDSAFWSQLDVVAKKEVVGKDTVIICDISKIKKKVNVPLSLLVDDYEFIKLDNSKEEALISRSITPVILSENYMGVYTCGWYRPFKLFTKEGEYLTDIGRIGQGPGEYKDLYYAQMDEPSDRIYLLPWLASKILVYDFRGNYLHDIPLAHFVPTGQFMVDTQTGRLTVLSMLHRAYSKQFVWIQDLEGRLIQGVSSEEYMPQFASFNSGIISGLHTDQIDVFQFHLLNQEEYLYHYDISTNQLKPVFRLEGMEKDCFVHELPTCFVVAFVHNTGIANIDDTDALKIIIDKKTLRGCYFDGFRMPSGILLDQYLLLSRMRNGDFTVHDFGSHLMTRIESVDRRNLTKQQREELDALAEMISEEDDDCSIVIKGRFKGDK